MALALKKRSTLPGFGLTMGYTMAYLSLIVIIPLMGLFFKSSTLSWAKIWATISHPHVVSSLKLTFGASLIAAAINAVLGFVIAWTLIRHEFPGKRIIDGLIDLPFALPTAVSGITLATLYSDTGWLGNLGGNLSRGINWVFGHEVVTAKGLGWMNLTYSYTRVGILIALVFIGIPFVVRTLQPALQDLDAEVEEAAASLGATRVQTFWRVVFPSLVPALLTGFSLAFARAVGEYGSVIFISTNKPGESQITAHLIAHELENHQYAEATTIGVIMLIISFVMLVGINILQWWATRRSRTV